MYKNISVFIFGAGGRQALPVCKGFYQLGCKVICYCKSKLDTGYMTRYHTKTILYKDIRRIDEDFNTCGARLILQNKYDLVVPLGDDAAKYLSNNKEKLSKVSKIAVNDWNIFQYSIDKLNTMRICKENGIPAPTTIISENPMEVMEYAKLKFPVVVKPRTGVGSIGFQIFSDMEKLNAYFKNYDEKNGPLLIQEYIEQKNNPQYRVDMFRDRDGIFRMAMVGKVTRWYPLDGGSGIYAYTIHNEEILDYCKKLLEGINWNGYANIDMVWDANTNVAKVLEINGRVGATIKLDYIAGANISQLILENELGYPVSDMLQYKDNCRISCFLPDILWFIKSKERFHCTPSWFDRKGVYDAIFSWDDPLPMIGFIFNSLKDYRKAMRQRQRV